MIAGLVSTIIPAYNRPALLREAVASVLAQDYGELEVIIVDDGSTDGDTFEVAKRLAAAHQGLVRAVTQENGGPGVAREHGRRLALGEFIQYLDSDDLLLPGKFTMQVQGLRNNPAAGISYGLTLSRDERTGLSKVTHGTDVAHGTLLPAVLKARVWPTCSPLYRREVCDAIGSWGGYRILEDWDYDLRAGLLQARLHYCTEPVALVRYHGGDHAGCAWQHDSGAMRDRTAAYVRAMEYAQLFGVERAAPEMRHLVRSVFWMAREAAASGLATEARALYHLARQHAINPGIDYAAFRVAASLIGWHRAGCLSRWMDKAGKAGQWRDRVRNSE